MYEFESNLPPACSVVSGTTANTYALTPADVLADVAPSTDELIYAWHPDGFALHSMRSPEITRMYLQVAPEEDLAREFLEAGEATRERVWRLPVWQDYRENLKSEWADMKNTGGRTAGTINAAVFLREFVPAGIPGLIIALRFCTGAALAWAGAGQMRAVRIEHSDGTFLNEESECQK